MLQRQAPQLPRNFPHRVWGIRQRKARLLRLQSLAEPLPPGLEPASHGVRGPGAQVGADALHRRAFACVDDGVGGGVDVGFGDASGHGRVSYAGRSEEHTSELQSLMRNSYAVFCLNKKIRTTLYK